MFMITELVFVAWFFSLLYRIVFEGPITDSTLHCAMEWDIVASSNVERFAVVVILHSVRLELNYARNELLDADGSMSHLISFVEGGEVALHLVADSKWLRLFVELAVVTPCWTCFHWLDKCFEVGVDEERGQAAKLVVLEVDFTPVSWLGHHEEFTATLQTPRIALL